MNKPSRLFDLTNYSLLALVGILTLYPFIYVIVYSFNDGMDAMKGGIYLWPRQFTFGNYITVFENASILSAYKITILRTLFGTVLAVMLCAIFGYALTKKTLPGRTLIVFFIFIPTLFQGGLIPTFIIYRELHLVDTFWVLLLPFLFNFWHIVILRTFFQQIPEELEESAKIEGYGDFRIFIHVILPLSVPVLATIAMFVAVIHWNDWFYGAFYITQESLIPMQTLLQKLLTQSQVLADAANQSNKGGGGTVYSGVSATPESLRMATLAIATIPVVCVYPFLQKYFTKGAMLGSVKG